MQFSSLLNTKCFFQKQLLNQHYIYGIYFNQFSVREVQQWNCNEIKVDIIPSLETSWWHCQTLLFLKNYFMQVPYSAGLLKSIAQNSNKEQKK